MILADASVWISHFRYGESKLAECLSEGTVLMHPCVSGELACGNLKDRTTILYELQELPAAELASDVEAFALLDRHKLWGRGIGWIDVHLLISAMLSSCQLWTLDKCLNACARDLGLA